MSSQTTGGARRGRPGYDVDSLLEVCVREFNLRGYDATSIGILAEALGVSKSAIYHHVDSKESLLAMALERALGGIDRVITAAEQVEDPTRRVATLLRGSIRLLIEEQPYVTLLLRLRGNSPVEIDAQDRRRHATRRMERMVAAAQQGGTLRDDVPAAVLTRLALGMVNSLTEWYRPDGRVPPSQMADTVSSVVLDGMRRGA